MQQIYKTWFMALRPKTLILAWLAVLIGNSLAFTTQEFNLLVAVLTLTTATLLQILTNLANDYGDSIKGIDNKQRLGPLRAMQTGLITPQQMRRAIFIIIGLTLISGLTLLFVASINTQQLIIYLFLGVASIIAALTYTLGKKPYGYLALGDAAVLLFFGLVAVVGSYFLQTAKFNAQVFLPAFAYGFLAVAVLNINNLRDIENDLQYGKVTFAALIGFKKAKIYQLSLFIFALSLFSLSLTFNNPSSVYLLLLASLVILLRHAYKVIKIKNSTQAIELLPNALLSVLVLSLSYSIIVIYLGF